MGPFLSARGKALGRARQRELYLVNNRPGDEAPGERLLTDAMAGNRAIVTGSDEVAFRLDVGHTLLDNEARAPVLK